MKNSARFLWIFLAFVLALAAAVVIAAYVWINRYLASDAFRRTVSQAASRALGVEGEFEAFRWSGFAIYSGGFSGTGGPASPIDTVAARELHASLNLSAAFRGVWQIDRLEVGTLRLELKEAPPGAAPAPVPAPPAAPLLPSTFRLASVGIREANLSWPAALAGGGSATRIAVEMKSVEGGWSVEGKGGVFAPARFPAEGIERFSLRLRPDRLYLTEAALQPPGGGTLRVAGEVGLGAEPDLDLRCEAAGVPVSQLLPEDWRARLSGNLVSDFRLTRAARPDASWHAEGKVRLDDGRLEALPVLDQMAELTHSREYRTLKLQTAESRFTLDPRRTELSGIAVESNGFARVEGGLVVTGDALDGTLQLGLPPERVRGLPGAARVFAEARGSYLWTPVRIGGTVQNPTEDLSPRVAAAVLQEVQEKVKGTVDQAVDLLRNFLH